MRPKKRFGSMVLVVLAAGCTSSGASGDGVPDAAAPAARTPLAGESDLPFAWYYDSAARWRANENRARSLLISDCMAEQGFTFAADGAPTPELRSYLEGWFGIGDEAVARTYGYVYPNTSPPEPEEPSDPAERQAYDLALWGPPASEQEAVVDPVTGQQSASSQLGTGCLAQASDELYGSDRARLHFSSLDIWIQSQAETAIEATRVAPAVVDAIDAWSECMADAGFEFASPSDPMTQEWPEPRPGGDELETAAADIQCKESTHYFDAVLAEEADNEQQAIEQHPDLVEQVQEARQAVDERATAILSGRQPD